jgi:cell division protein FtsL
MATLIAGAGVPAGGREHTGFLYDGVAAGREVRAELARRSAASRPLPMEDLCFFVKPIDNSRLVKVMDPHSKWDIVKTLAGSLFAFALALSYLIPYVSMVRSGYRIEELKREHAALAAESRRLVAEEARLRNPERIERLARTHLGLQKPAAERVAWADGTTPGAEATDLLAQNLSRLAVETR